MSIYKQKAINEAKAKATVKGKIEVKCEYCAHSLGEHPQLKRMWHCALLGHHATAYRGCDAMRKGVGDFKVDAKLYKEWIVKQKEESNE